MKTLFFIIIIIIISSFIFAKLNSRSSLLAGSKDFFRWLAYFLGWNPDYNYNLVLSYEELLEMLKIYLPKTTNEATQLAKIEATIKKVVEMGFLRELDSDPSLKRYEVRRIIKALVQSDTLTQIKEKFKELLQDRA